MPYSPHYLLSMGGGYWETETWSVGLRFYDEQFGGTVDSIAPAVVNGMAVACSAFVSSTVAISNEARLDYVKFNAIGADGRYAYDGTVEVDLSGDGINGGGAAGIPQIAVCVSTTTGKSRGRASKGRFYLPGLIQIASDGRIQDGACQQVAGEAAAWISACNDAFQAVVPGGGAAVMSELGAPGPHELITGVRVGDVLDTQRRRRNQMPETYFPAPLP